MKSVVVVGAQWGDEGKGKVVDYLAGSFDYIARVAGGHNAGHTVIIGKEKYVLQLIPCGILRPKQHAVIGTGVVIDPAALVNEIEMLAKVGIDVQGRLHISNRAHLIFPYHRELDKAAETARGANKIGTTSRGIGPAYEDKMARRGLRTCDLLDPALFREKAARVVAEKNRLAKGAYGADIDFSHEVDETLQFGEKIRPYICDTAELVNHALDEGKSILFEGAQGTMLDIDHGTYPYVTSSSATSGGATMGTGVPPTRIKHVLGISKAYTTRVGGGPFPTEMPDLDAQEVRERGKEFGAVTGRPRRCGWLDLALLRYAKMINGIDSLVVTKLDVFDTQREIQVCIGYKYKGKTLQEMPALSEEYEKVTPEYKTLPGWCQSTYGETDAGKLPKAAVDYLRFISDFLQLEIGMISTGPERDATIVQEGTLFSSWL
ncbi:MAG TPA: adenylosuccinate synthase [Candidatus Eisenbacteria bacterium]|jgi:adenylosuccinate synthase|nr:adenylosuccinate synthase [Candidatus Eisenbacteria bacterium]